MTAYAMSKHPFGKRSKAQREEDRALISEWFREGVENTEMHRRINERHEGEEPYPISTVTVWKDAQKNVARWQKQALANVDEMRELELAKLRKAEEANWRGWKRSLKDAEEIHTERTTKGDDPGDMVDGLFEKERKVAKGQSGNPTFLRNIAGLIEQRCKLLGLNAPEQVEVKANWAALLKDEHEHAMIDVEADEVPAEIEEAAGDESTETAEATEDETPRD